MMSVVMDYIALGWWSTLFFLHWCMVHFVKFVAPFSVVKRRICGLIEGVGVKVTCVYEEGKEEAVVGDLEQGKYKVEIVVKDKAFFYKVFGANKGIGEAYMAGMFECDNIQKFVACLLKLPLNHGRFLANKVALARNRQGVKGSMKVADVHYNLGNDLYKIMLDEGMSYTCALWYPETKTLEEAQNNKHDIVGRKLKLKPGMKVLDLGGGFGSAAKYLAQNFGVSVTVYNISKEQVKYGRESCKDVDVTFVLADYRTATGEFDAVYSIGICEHIGSQNYREFYQLINSCLKPEGLALTHTIISADHETRTDPWTCKYIFPGGELPYMRDLLIDSSPFFVTEDVQSFAKSYAKTLHEWNARFEANWPKIKHNYEDEFDGQFYRLWTWYLKVCEGAFLSRRAQLVQVVHSKFTREEEYYSVRDQRD